MFRKVAYTWLQSGTKYKFVTSVVTQSSEANMSDELEGASSNIEATYFDNEPELSALSLVAGDSQMTLSWSALSDFDMPASLSAFSSPDAPTDLVVSDLA